MVDTYLDSKPPRVGQLRVTTSKQGLVIPGRGQHRDISGAV